MEIQGPESEQALLLDIEKHGSLSNCLDALWAEMKSPLRYKQLKKLFKTHGRVEFNGCHSWFRVPSENPRIEFNFWKDGVILGNFAVASAEEAAQVLHQLFVLEQSIMEVEPQLSKFQLNEHTPAFLEGPKAYTERQWQKLDEWFSSDPHFKILRPVLMAARAHPQLGQLYPFQSMFSFYLSRCTGYPFDTVCSGIQPTAENGFYQENGIYAVTNKYKQTGIEFEGTVEDAIAFIAAQLPPDCGPARQGNLETFHQSE